MQLPRCIRQPEQASADIAAYKKSNPRALRYDSSAKQYVGAADMRCVLGAPELGDGLALLHGFTDTVTIAHIDLPIRSALAPLRLAGVPSRWTR